MENCFIILCWFLLTMQSVIMLVIYMCVYISPPTPPPSHPARSSQNTRLDSPCYLKLPIIWASQVVLVVKNPSANAGYVRDVDSIRGSRRFPGEGNSNPLQYSCLENLTDRRVWWATVHRLQGVGHD